MTFTWVRGTQSVSGLTAASQILANVPRASTLMRLRYQWWCTGTTSTLYSIPDIQDTVIAVGAITGDNGGSFVPPNALTTPNDPAPPLERWIWWECRHLIPRTWGSAEDDVVTFTDSGVDEATDSHSEVLANVAVGHTLGVYLSWAPNRADFPGAGYIQVGMWWSLLYKT